MGFWLTRPVARRQARALFDLCAGFVYSQVLLACVQLRLFQQLADGPLDASALAERLALPEASAITLLEAARSLSLVERHRDKRYGLGIRGAALLGNPGAMAMIEHHPLLYADLADPVALLREAPGSRRLATYWPYAATASSRSLPASATAPYTALMANSQAMIAAEILDAYRVGAHRCLLDIGGGDGAFLTAVAARAPTLRLMLFDLPAVAAQASTRLARAGLAHRSVVCSGDFRLDPLPTGADLATLVRVLHDHDDDTVLSILRAVRRSLAAGGTLLVAEPMADTPGAEPVGHAYFGMYLKAMGSGRPRSAGQLTTLLQAAGFDRIRTARTRSPLLTSLLVAC